MYIITNPDQLKTELGDSYKSCLAVGEGFEELVVNDLRSHGIRAYRPKQDNLPRELLQSHQIDILVPRSMGSRICIEVKARNNPWEYWNVAVGNVKKWDDKKHTYAVVVIDQVTGDTRISRVEIDQWSRQKLAGELSYTVPRSRFSYLDAFIDWYKDRYPLMLSR